MHVIKECSVRAQNEKNYKYFTFKITYDKRTLDMMFGCMRMTLDKEKPTCLPNE
jgi:hypothetical protein